MRNDTKLTILNFGLGLFAGMALLATLGATWTPSGGTGGVIGGTTNQVSAVNIVTTTSSATALAACATTGGPEPQRIRIIQNVGVVPVLYRLGGTASAADYHGVLAPGNNERDGYGTQLDVSLWRGPVSIAVESGTGIVATVEVVAGK